MDSFDVMWVLLHSLYIAALCAFTLRLFDKLVVITRYQMHAPRWMPRDCTFCFSWWFGVIACGNLWLIFGPDLHLVACLPVIPVFTISLMKR